MRIKWSGSYGRKNLYSKQLEDSKTNPIGKSYNIKKYVQGYQKCQQNKVQHMKKVGKYYLLKTPQEP